MKILTNGRYLISLVAAFQWILAKLNVRRVLLTAGILYGFDDDKFESWPIISSPRDIEFLKCYPSYLIVIKVVSVYILYTIGLCSVFHIVNCFSGVVRRSWPHSLVNRATISLLLTLNRTIS